MVEIATLDLHRFGIHNRLDQIVMHLVTEQKCQYSYLSEVTLLVSRVLVWITYEIAYLLHIYIYICISLVNVLNHFPEITRFAAFCATVGLWDANGGSKISTAMGHCSNPQERMDKRCERWVFCEYGCHSIFWEISVYIYICRGFLYSILITTQLILFLVFGNRRRSGRTSHNVLTGGVMSKTSTVSTNFPVGLFFLFPHVPPQRLQWVDGPVGAKRYWGEKSMHMFTWYS